MKTTLIVLAAVVILILISLAQKSHTPPKLGLKEGRFEPCRYSSNCVNSMARDESAITPIGVDGDALRTWSLMPGLITAMGGQIEQKGDHYLWATFRSRWLGFVDDVELSLDEDNKAIHVRSSSRVGRSDFQVNRKRVEQLRERVLSAR